MPIFRFRDFGRSLRYALRGLGYAIRQEQSFRLELIVGLLVLVAAAVFRVSNVRVVLLTLLITLVLVLELLNTFFEKLVDLLSPRVHAYAALLKDLLAATVLLASLGAVVAGVLIFWPYVS